MLLSTPKGDRWTTVGDCALCSPVYVFLALRAFALPTMSYRMAATLILRAAQRGWDQNQKNKTEIHIDKKRYKHTKFMSFEN